MYVYTEENKKEVSLRDEHAYIKRTLGANHYPMPFVRSYSCSYSGARQNTPPPRRSVVIPYVRGLSEGIKRILSSADVRVVFRPHSSLRQELVHPKDPVPTMQKANVVYRIPCTSCSSVYVGQTSRTLEAHLKEHKAAVKHARTSLCAVVNYVWIEHHQMDFSGTSVLAREPDTRKRCMLEAWFIRKHNTLNKEDECLPLVYSTLP